MEEDHVACKAGHFVEGCGWLFLDEVDVKV